METGLENQGSAMLFMMFREGLASRNLIFDLQPINAIRTQNL